MCELRQVSIKVYYLLYSLQVTPLFYVRVYGGYMYILGT